MYKSPKILTIISLLIIIPLGFATKFYHGIYANWVNNSLCGIFYEIFWCLLIFLIFSKLSPFKIAIIVFIITSLLEFTQLWKAPFLETVRKNFIGRTLIGSSFTWSDFPYYLIGCVVAYFLMNSILK
jgi:ABC-type dipeptide/oligopeptide/nickel transport system permease subunit